MVWTRERERERINEGNGGRDSNKLSVCFDRMRMGAEHFETERKRERKKERNVRFRLPFVRTKTGAEKDLAMRICAGITQRQGETESCTNSESNTQIQFDRQNLLMGKRRRRRRRTLKGIGYIGTEKKGIRK